MYKTLRRWDDAIKLAERRGYPGLKELRNEQMAYLLRTGQEEQAGQVLEERDEPDQAMTLYMKAKKTARAARLALKMPHLLQNETLMTKIVSALVKSGFVKFFFRMSQITSFPIFFPELYELAGDLTYKLDKAESSIAMYRVGGCFSRAIDLARNVSPEEVTILEEEWGDWYDNSFYFINT